MVVLQQSIQEIQEEISFPDYSSAGSIISGAAVGGITLNLIIIGVLTSVGVISKVLSNFKKYDKVESTRYASTTYKKVLDESRMYLRGGKTLYNHEDFVKSMKIIDDVIVDNCPEVEAYWKEKYEELYYPVRSTEKIFNS